ncbi:MAG: alpha/beta hydrolase [Kaistella sp.]
MKEEYSFALQSEYLKQLKKYPFIKKIGVQNNPLIKMEDNLVYKNLPNRKLHLDAFIHKSKENLPAVLLVHGGGWKSGSKEMQNALAEKIATEGYQTFTIEYRLSEEAKYPAAIDDVHDVINFIKKNAKEFKIDAAKIAILGCSSGGQMASLIGAKYPAEVNAVIDIDGILAFHHPDSQEGKMAALWLGGTYEEIPEVWNDASALAHVSDKTPPFLFINSQFKRFSAGQSDFIKKLNGFGIYSKVERIENSPHTFWLFDPWFQPTTKYIVNFLNFTFKKDQNENL